MLKKSLIILSVFCFMVFTSSLVFATNIVEGAENTLNDIGNGIRSMVDDATNSVEDVKDGATNMVNDMRNDTDSMENDMRTDDNQTGITGGTDNDGYTASRTGANAEASNTNTAIVWVVLAIAGAIIIALVWYYGTQTSDRNNQ